MIRKSNNFNNKVHYHNSNVLIFNEMALNAMSCG